MPVWDYVVSQFRTENHLPGLSVTLAGKRAETDSMPLIESDPTKRARSSEILEIPEISLLFRLTLTAC